MRGLSSHIAHLIFIKVTSTKALRKEFLDEQVIIFWLGYRHKRLYTAQRGLTNVNHNVDNINILLRQVLEQTVARPMLMVDGSECWERVAATGIKRIR